LVAKHLLEHGKLDGRQMTPSGKTLAEEAALAVETPGQDVVTTCDRPLKPNGGLVILKGNVSPWSGPRLRS
jgi:dihydroxy-acid dehydratase